MDINNKARIHWACRRGMRELDISIMPFFELKMGDNWRRTGTVLAAVQLEDGQVLVQVVMNNDMEADSVFRVRDDANTLSIKPLPYSLDEE